MVKDRKRAELNNGGASSLLKNKRSKVIEVSTEAAGVQVQGDLPKRTSADDIPGNYSNRIFIGGNYKKQLAVILEMAKFIRYELRGHFVPIVATDFKIPEGNERDYCLRLLHNCKFAIFELTDPSGQLIEVERAIDYGTVCLYVFNTFDPLSESHQITAMVKGGRQHAKGYKSLDELKAILRHQMQRWKRLSQKDKE